MTSIIKLLAKDGKLLEVAQDVIKQMVTIQSMLDCPLVDDNNDDDKPIPIFAVNGEVLDKLVKWTKCHLENTNNAFDCKVWSDKFFMENLDEILVLEEGAKYLDLRSYLKTSEILMDEKFQVLSNTESFMRNISRERFGELLARDTLNVPNEEAVFKSLAFWISMDPEERSKFLDDLVPNIRAHFLPRYFVDKHLKAFLKKHGNPDLCHKLNYKSTTPRQEYEDFSLYYYFI